MNKNVSKKYLIISHNYWPALGGAEKLFQSIAENLKRDGVDVEVLTSNAKNAAVYFSRDPELIGNAEDDVNGINVYREDIRNVFQFSAKIIWNLFKKNKNILLNIEPILIGPHFVKFVLRYVFCEVKYTHIICGPFPTSVPFYGYIMKLIYPKTKLIIDPSLHVDDPMHTGKWLRFVARKADALLVRTEEETLTLNSWGIEKSKIVEIGVGVDEWLLDDEKIVQNDKIDTLHDYILYMGQEVIHKNIIVLIDAMEKIWNDGHSHGLLIAGARTDYSECIDNRINNLKMEHQKKIVRINNFNDNIKKQLIDNCQMMVLPSSRESFGIVFIEGWSRKKPVIGANVAGVRFLIDDKKNGFLFKENDVNDLKKKIVFLITNKSIAKKMGEEGYKKVIKKYTWKKITKKIVTL